MVKSAQSRPPFLFLLVSFACHHCRRLQASSSTFASDRYNSLFNDATVDVYIDALPSISNGSTAEERAGDWRALFCSDWFRLIGGSQGMGQRGVEVSIVVRVYDPEKDLSATETVDRQCDGGATGQVSLCMDLLGDPASRVRHSPAYRMLVPAELLFLSSLRSG